MERRRFRWLNVFWTTFLLLSACQAVSPPNKVYSSEYPAPIVIPVGKTIDADKIAQSECSTLDKPPGTISLLTFEHQMKSGDELTFGPRISITYDSAVTEYFALQLNNELILSNSVIFSTNKLVHAYGVKIDKSGRLPISTDNSINLSITTDCDFSSPKFSTPVPDTWTN